MFGKKDDVDPGFTMNPVLELLNKLFPIVLILRFFDHWG